MLGKIPIILDQSDTREENIILAIQSCQNEEWFAIISGKNLIKDEQEPNKLYIYKRKSSY